MQRNSLKKEIIILGLTSMFMLAVISVLFEEKKPISYIETGNIEKAETIDSLQNIVEKQHTAIESIKLSHPEAYQELQKQLKK